MTTTLFVIYTGASQRNCIRNSSCWRTGKASGCEAPSFPLLGVHHPHLRGAGAVGLAGVDNTADARARHFRDAGLHYRSTKLQRSVHEAWASARRPEARVSDLFVVVDKHLACRRSPRQRGAERAQVLFSTFQRIRQQDPRRQR